MEEIFIAYKIVEENRDDIMKVYKTTMPARAGEPVEFKLGNLIVIQTVNFPDIFDDRFGGRFERSWEVTPEQFAEKFEVQKSSEGYICMMLNKK